VHLSRVFTSRNDGLDKLAISAPFRPAGPDGPVWVLGATVPTDARLGLTGLHDARRKAALLAPRDTGVPSETSDYVILVHEAYSPGERPASLPSVKLHRVDDTGFAADEDYADPVAATHPEYAGRWLAGFAPVPGTELVVLVQQRYDQAVAPQGAFLRHLLAWVGGAFGLAILLVAGLWLARRRPA
jgi:hypothetical protein